MANKIYDYFYICSLLELLSKLPNQTSMHFALGENTSFYKSMHVMDKTILGLKNVLTYISKIVNVIHEKWLDTITLSQNQSGWM